MNRSLRIAVLCSFNLDLVKRPLSEGLKGIGLDCEVYFSGYGLWEPDAVDQASSLHRFAPDVVIVYADAADLLPPLSEGTLLPSAADSIATGRAAWQRLNTVLSGLLSSLSPEATVFVHNLSRNGNSTLGTLEDNAGYSVGAAVDVFNGLLRAEAQTNSRIHVIDYAGFVAEHGHAALRDDRLWHIGRMRLGRAGMTRLAVLYVRYLSALLLPRRKCLVLDLDNTLWGGVLGEDGVDGIAIGQEGIGLAFREFQLAVRALAHRGVVLAIASKNNPADALEVLDNHPEMVLRSRDFAAMEIHWNPKSESLLHIAQQLNLGLDSFVFWDDEPREREVVRTQHPVVLVPEIPADPSDYARALLNLGCFDVVNLTEEDRKRGQMYREEADRQKSLEGLAPSNLAEYYHSLGMNVTIDRPDAYSVARFAQLTQRTNQFNFTTRRYSEGDIRAMLDDPACGLYTLNLEDRFGKLGVIGAAVVRPKSGTWQLDTFLMSCRALGRGVEDAFLATLVTDAARAGADLHGTFLATRKNEPARQFLERLGIAIDPSKTDGCDFAIDRSSVTVPEWIKLIRN